MTCPSCGYPNPAGAAACESCDTPLGPSEPRGGPPPASEAPRRVIVGVAPRAQPGVEAADEPEEEPLRLGGLAIPRGLAYVLGGLPVAVLLGLTCLGGLIEAGLVTLTHEGGHALVAWFFGHLAVPTAKGFTVSYGQKPLFALAVWALLVFAAWRFRQTRPVAVALGLVALLYPLLAASEAHYLLVVFAGHGTEVAVGAAFLWRAQTGGIVQEVERPAYAVLGWLLIAYNLKVWASIAFDWGASRAIYDSISITGGDNDMIKLADALGWQLASVATVTLAYTIALPTAAISLWWFVWRHPAGRRRLLERLSFSRD